jgi:hypothetical protein
MAVILSGEELEALERRRTGWSAWAVIDEVVGWVQSSITTSRRGEPGGDEAASS